MHANGGQNFFERVDRVVELLLRGDVDLRDDDEEGQVEGHEEIEVLLGHRHHAGVRAHLSWKKMQELKSKYCLLFGHDRQSRMIFSFNKAF